MFTFKRGQSSVQSCRGSQALKLPVLTAMFLILALTALALSGGTEGSSPSPRIFYGRLADPTKYPFYAKIEITVPSPNPRRPFIKHCGGTIINGKFVLTALHCAAILDQNQNYLGLHPTNRFLVKYNIADLCQNQYDSVRVKRIHLFGNRISQHHDIAILELVSAPRIPPSPSVALPETIRTPELIPGFQGVVIGMGESEFERTSCRLRELNMAFGNRPVRIRKRERGRYFSTRARNERPQSTIGGGDSGGPWLRENSYGNTYTIYGVASGTSAQSGTQAFYADVSQYLDWIKDTIRTWT